MQNYHLLVVQLHINNQSVQGLIDMQTVGGDLISAQYCQLYNIPIKELTTSLQLDTTIKGSRSQVTKCAEVTLDWLGFQEPCVMYVTNLKD